MGQMMRWSDDSVRRVSSGVSWTRNSKSRCETLEFTSLDEVLAGPAVVPSVSASVSAARSADARSNRDAVEAARAEGYRSGHATGFEAGYVARVDEESATVREVITDAQQRVDAAILAFDDARSRALQEAGRFALELGRAVATRLLRAELKADPKQARSLIRAVVDESDDLAQLRVHVHPTAAAALENRIPMNDPWGRAVVLVADAEVPMGNCTVSDGRAAVHGDLAARVDRLVEAVEADLLMPTENS